MSFQARNTPAPAPRALSNAPLTLVGSSPSLWAARLTGGRSRWGFSREFAPRERRAVNGSAVTLSLSGWAQAGDVIEAKDGKGDAASVAHFVVEADGSMTNGAGLRLVPVAAERIHVRADGSLVVAAAPAVDVVLDDAAPLATPVETPQSVAPVEPACVDETAAHSVALDAEAPVCVAHRIHRVTNAPASPRYDDATAEFVFYVAHGENAHDAVQVRMTRDDALRLAMPLGRALQSSAWHPAQSN